MEKSGDGCIYLRSHMLLDDYENNLGSWLYHWAEHAPERCFVAEKDTNGDWQNLSYSQALRDAQAIGQSLLEQGLSIERPLMILSGNSLNFARLQLGALLAAIPVVPVSPPYSLMSQDFDKLKHIVQLTTPGIVYAESEAPFARAMQNIADPDIEFYAADRDGLAKARDLNELLAGSPGEKLHAAYQQIDKDSIVKILFTSGSTGMPKGVINTQQMLCSNQQAYWQLWPFLKSKPPVIVDWLVWNHTFGSCHNFNMMLVNGGTLYIDAGKPLPGLIETTVANLKEISPTLYFNVPAGYDALLNYLENDVDLRDTFFRNLDVIYCASASLGERTRQRLNDLSRKVVGTTPPLLSGWGATETAPLATGTWLPTDLPGAIGQPIPGTEIKLKPFAEKYEIRVRGVNVFPGYWRQPRMTEDVFDSEGFYKIGDTAILADDNDPNAGIIFKGRTAEEFKLDTGTWVSVGTLRLKIIGACAPLIQDAVIAGQDRHEIAVLLVPDIKLCVEQLEEPQADSTLAELAASDELRREIRQRLQQFNADYPASSTRVGFFDFIDSPLNIDSGEMTDKRYINQRGVRESHSGQIEAMYDNEDYRVGEP
ncbi:MAG: feruloyl-CoA synthase [Pseudomonadales bacterium]|jgi:feruloyl-CoA synthase|nr:feruloyl-CoA synthase [Pseudomonadales bacterium]MDP6469999.1 feruloyl-CoA synthase [Pseudomonadales bacterium]MDP6826899.1 feruloyl-CoA synthase [Pseudomonadales bacterium]|tara:strand:+ start:4903 stop:6690 length:1788 start_codon:yes stop_codon:yes gene_type:complete